ncbi:MAG: aldehyde dehydrogenase family protein [Desulfobacterota bacterium]|nr:aldehyde dehydrogenase family protein [Thermodesulfobacteriota bacterium]
MERHMNEELQGLLDRARKAQAIVEHWDQEKVDEMVLAAAWEAIKPENAQKCADLACKETKMGVYENKLTKHRNKALGALRDLQGVKTTGIVEEDKAKGIFKVIKPVGVIFAPIPCTNPTATPVVKGIYALKTRNAIIFAPHMIARRCSGLAIEFMRKGLEKVGAPVDLIQVMEKPFIEDIQAMMAAADLVISTGGTQSVKAAYSSGKPAYGVGAGNSVAIVDDTANIQEAAEKIVASKTFDNATSCSAENSAVIHESKWDGMIEAFKKIGGYLCTGEEKAKLKAALWPDGEHINQKVVARPAKKIAEIAGIQVPDTTTFIMVIGELPVESDKFADEKLSPVITLWKYSSFSEAIEFVKKIHAVKGEGHCCAIHTTSREHILELAEQVHVSRMMVNQPQCLANSGAFTNGMPFTMSLGCGTWGNNISSDNITWRHMVNYTWVSEPIPENKPDEEKIFKSYWDKHGK